MPLRLLVTLVALLQARAPEIPIDERSSLFGFALSAVGDVDRDGIVDLLVGDPDDGWEVDSPGDRPGSAYLISGRTGGTLRSWSGDSPGDWFGSTVRGVGDLDGDSLPDVVVGAEGCRGGEGHVRAFSSATGAALYTLCVPADDVDDAWDSCGAGPTLCALGDVDGDGRADYLIGSKGCRKEDGSAPDTPGRVAMVSGREGRVLYTVPGERAGDRFGLSLTSIDDLDGDRVSEWAAGGYVRLPIAEAPGWRLEGYVDVRSGRDGSLLRRHVGQGTKFGCALARLPDADGDGVADYAIAAAHVSESRAIRIHSGWDGRILQEIAAPWGAGHFGMVLAALADLDGDGLAELLVGGRGTFEDESDTCVWLFSSNRGECLLQLSKITLQEIGLGTQVVAIGDLDGDGVEDWGVSSCLIRGNDGSANVRLYSGRTRELLRVLRPPARGG